MDHVIDYIIKSDRPKKPLVILWGTSPEMARLFRKNSDLYMDPIQAGSVKAHATTLPLFDTPATLWVVGSPDISLLKSMCQSEIVQRVIFECVTKDAAPELDGVLKTKIKLLSISDMKPGSTQHKNALSWYLKREFPYIPNDTLECLSGIASQYFSKDILYGLDRLAQWVYSLPKSSLVSESSLKRYSMTIPQDQWSILLHQPDTAIINVVLKKFFEKSRSVYSYLSDYLEEFTTPLPLLSALQDLTEKYLEACWAVHETKGRDEEHAQSFAQGRKVYRATFSVYKDTVSKFYGEKILWDLARETCLTQAKYRMGVTSKLPLYTLVGHFIGAGL